MTSLADLVSVEHRSVRSVNVEHDLESTSPLAGFVATEQILDGVRRLLASCRSGATGRAWSVTGPYGAGKSSFAHFLCALLAAEQDSSFRDATMLLGSADDRLFRALLSTRQDLGVTERGFIRAVVTAEREPVAATVARALYRGADGYWGGRRGRRPDVLHELHAVNTRSGQGQFADPRFVLDAIEQLSAVAPIMLVLDELGKALEFAADRSRESDLYLLQQLAERFSSATRMHGCLLGLQHLAFEDYATGLSATRRREWRKIQGRFEDVAFTGGTGHSARLIGASVRLGAVPPQVTEAMQEATQCLAVAAPDTSAALASLGPAPSGYPLHPTTVPALVELAARFGQHERSLMAFLTSDAPEAFPALLRSRDAGEPPTFVRLPEIYDYFVDGAASLAVLGDDAARLREVRGRIAEATGLDRLETMCLKTIGVLNLVGRGHYRASPDLILQAVSGPSPSAEQETAVRDALDRLVRAGLLTFRDFAREYRVWQGSDFDVAGAIGKRREQLAQDAVVHGPPIGHIASAHPARALVARRHSQRVEALRYFEARYIGEMPTEPPRCDRGDADGLLLYLLAPEPPEAALPRQTEDGRPVIILASRFVPDITEAAVDAAATRAVLEASHGLEHDVAARREIRHRAALAQASLSERVEAAFDPTRAGVTCFATGQRVAISRQRDFSELLSTLCDETYSHSPVVSTEMLNRRELTSQGAKTRRELVERMFTMAGEQNLGITGYGPDRAMYESVLASTGLHRKRDGRPSFGAPHAGSGLTPAWKAIEAFMDAAVERPVGIEQLYSRMMAPPYGMKEGPIPVLLAAVLLARADDVFVFEEGSFLPRLGPEHFERLVKTPDRFSVKRAAMLGLRADVFRELQELSSSERPAALPADVRNATTLAVVRPLITLLQSLPEFSRTTGRVSTTAQRVRHALATSREPDELLFGALPEACRSKAVDAATPVASQNDSTYIPALKDALDELAGAYDRLLDQLADTLRTAFDTRGPRHALREELRTRARHLTEHVIDRRIRSFLLMAANEELDDREWLEALATVLAQKPPASWSDSDISVFDSGALEIARTFRRLELLHLQMSTDGQAGFVGRRITATHPDGTEASQLLWLEESRSPALAEVLDAALEKARRVAGPHAAQGLLTLLADRVLTDAVGTTRAERDQPSSSARAAS